MLEFGSKLSNIIKLDKEKKSMTKNLIVIFDGEEHEPIECKNISVNIENDNMILNVTTKKDIEHSTDENIPSNQGIIAPTENEVFFLSGDDYDSFIAISECRRSENMLTEKKEGRKLEAITIESSTYDIQDLQSVSNATLDIVAKEQELLNEGYKTFKANDPRYIYENDNNFKLVETVVLCKEEKEKDAVKETKSN